MKQKLLIIKGKLFVSYSYLMEKGIPLRVLSKWSCRGTSNKYSEGKYVYVSYDSIPEPTRQTLPDEALLREQAKAENSQIITAGLTNEMQAAYDGKDYLQHIKHFKETYGISDKKATEWGRKWEAWKVLAKDIQEGTNSSQAQFEAAKAVFGYKTYNSFNNQKSRLKKIGAEQMAVDKRLQNSAPESCRATAVQIAWVMELVADARKLSAYQIWLQHSELSRKQGLEPMSEKWVELEKQKLLKGNVQVYRQRHGTSLTNSKMLPYAKMQQAKHANTQWQIDGKVLAFAVDVNKKVKRFTLFTVVDAYSKMIVGYSIGESENKHVVMAAIRDAVKTTECLPHEIVADNSSFQKTQEAKYFISFLNDRGLHMTVTSNPKGKIVSERYNQYLDAECRLIPGFLGIGITSHSDDAQIKQELTAQYYKNLLDRNRIIQIACTVVERYNTNQLPKFNNSPAELYASSDQPYKFPVDAMGNMKATLDYEPKAVRNGQIRFRLDNGRNEIMYRLPTDAFEQHNNTSVWVRYADVEQQIFVYTAKKDEAICSITPMRAIAAAKADQDEQSVKQFHKNAAQVKSVEVHSRETVKQKKTAAEAENPEYAFELKNHLLSKDVNQEIQENLDLRLKIDAHGGNPHNLTSSQQFADADSISHIEESKPKPSPFYPKNNKMQKFNPYEAAEDDLNND